MSPLQVHGFLTDKMFLLFKTHLTGHTNRLVLARPAGSREPTPESGRTPNRPPDPYITLDELLDFCLFCLDAEIRATSHHLPLKLGLVHFAPG